MPTTKGNPRRTYARDMLVKRVRALGLPCHICGLPIDYSLRTPDPLSYELDEVVPVSRGGACTLANSAPAHRCCNRWKSDRMPSDVDRVRSEAARRFGPWPSPLAFVECAKAICAASRGSRQGTPIRSPKRTSGAL